MQAGAVKVLVNFGVNAVYSAPSDLKFAEGLSRVEESAYCGAYGDETSKRCNWVVPQAHFLERWGYIRAHDDTVRIMLPHF